IYYKTSNGNKKHNSVLLPAIDSLLSESGLQINDVQNIACVVGPGSFTGIRLGVTTCNGLAFACGSNRIAINTFEPVAYNNTNDILVALDCRHGNYYVGQYKAGKEISLFNATEQDLASYNCEIIKWNGEREINKIVDCVLDKINNNEFCEMLSPLYLKKSQAEREAEC
ncbi:MAG: tRNA (adenosine(37)-N6)-threonylcarbamoyltransferase complex dimerization subunit type 1 TsaB, partial [Clostridia bacterium]|nr:tRNA (adenosine(37)-N6)-threonylcarbamoyltransferase complex dimerization subunit type 1 TsaB [Clostridia bacterium]